MDGLAKAGRPGLVLRWPASVTFAAAHAGSGHRRVAGEDPQDQRHPRPRVRRPRLVRARAGSAAASGEALGRFGGERAVAAAPAGFPGPRRRCRLEADVGSHRHERESGTGIAGGSAGLALPSRGSVIRGGGITVSDRHRTCQLTVRFPDRLRETAGRAGGRERRRLYAGQGSPASVLRRLGLARTAETCQLSDPRTWRRSRIGRKLYAAVSWLSSPPTTLGCRLHFRERRRRPHGRQQAALSRSTCGW